MNLSRARAKLIPRLRQRRTRVREGAYLAEGVRCVAEVVDAGASVRFAVRSPRLLEVPGGAELAAKLTDRGVEVIPADDSLLAQLAATETPQGVIAVCDEPQMDLAQPRRVLLADAIQDPGNLGTLIRSAAAFGVDAVIALDGSVDPYNPKAVRASAGAIARVPVTATSWNAVEEQLANWDLPLYCAAAGGDPGPVARGRWALAIGNEGRGVRDSIRAAATGGIAIPMAADVDSLNAGVAGSILMYALSNAETDLEEQ